MRFRMRRTNAKVLMVLAILVFGVFIRIGYALLSQDLTIGGLAIASKTVWGVHFVENSIVEDFTHLDSCSSGNECSRVLQHATIGQNGKSVNFGITFHAVDDYYEFTVDVINDGTIDVMLNEIVKEGLSGNTDYLDFTVTYSDGMPIAQYDQLLKNGGTETLKVKVKCISELENDLDVNLGLTANYIKATNNSRSRSYDPETMIRSLNTLGRTIADDDPDGNLRFIGADPNNYVWFNGQKWRIIGVFDGRLKIVRDSIGNYSWDTSESTVNSGYGIAVWGPTTYRTTGEIYTGADLMKLLNPGYETNVDYKCIGTRNGFNCGTNSSSDFELASVNNSLFWNGSQGICYVYSNYETKSCDFRTMGLQTDEARNMIDTATWYLGTNPTTEDPGASGRMTASYLYNMERSSNSGNVCPAGSSCSDINNVVEWQGKVGLVYPSDFAYATGGGNTYSRSECLSYQIAKGTDASYPYWDNTYTDCKNSDWLYSDSGAIWTITSRAYGSISNAVYGIYPNLLIANTSPMNTNKIRPTVYLKTSVVFTNEGNGRAVTPFVLRDLSDVHTVTFDANGGIVSSTTKQVEAGSNIGTLPTPTAPTGKTFDGWYTTASGGTKITSSYIPTGNVTIYAHWLQIYDPETRIRAINTLGTSVADDDPDNNLRFIGTNPNNYVSFNNQKWRIIGVFDGRLKIVQDSIGEYSWDTSKNDINNGFGINQWGPNNSGYTGAAIMRLLNPGYETNSDLKCNTATTITDGVANCGDNTDSNYSTGLVNNSLYWTASSGKCYTGGNYNVADCNFSSTGLSDTKSKNMIDDATWYLGSNDSPSENIWDGRITASVLYNWERSNNSSKQCNSGNYCNDLVDRTTRWQGKVGLIYPSDYAYATAGGNTYQRSDCLSYAVGYVNVDGVANWQNTYTECKSNDWLLPSGASISTLSSRAYSSGSSFVLFVNPAGYVSNAGALNSTSVRPTVYLKPGVVFTNEGDGKYDTPFVLRDIANVNTVTFNANGGTISPTTRQVDGGSSIGTLPTPTAPAGKIFDGWYTSSTGGSKVSSSYIPTGNVTIYAHWTQVYDPETRIRALNTLGKSIADDDPDNNLRFIGADPNNYVRFNNQTWRIIGVFDGKLKIVQDSIGNYSWDTSKNDVNGGYGVNQWSQDNNSYTGSDLMKLLNPQYESNTDLKCNSTITVTDGVINCGDNTDSNYSVGLVNNSLYWNASSGTCYTNGNYKVVDCDFTTTGLSDKKSKNMIDNATWYLGSNSTSEDPYAAGRMTASYLYNMERSDNAGNACNSGIYCTDNLDKITSWQGKVGLIYPSDYAYATGGGNTYQRSDCLSYQVGYAANINPNWNNTYTECMDNDWLLNKSMWTWTLSPRATSSNSRYVFDVNSTGVVNYTHAMYAGAVHPTVYLKSNVKFINNGTGTSTNPFVLKMVD